MQNLFRNFTLWLKSVFSWRRKDTLLQDILDKVLDKHGIKLTGSSFYEDGRNFFIKSEAEEYAANVINARFSSLKHNFLVAATDKTYRFQYKLQEEEILHKYLYAELDTINPNSYLYDLTERLENSKKAEADIENNSLSEAKMRLTIEEGFSDYKKNLEDLGQGNKTDDEILQLVISQGNIARFVTEKLKNIKGDTSIIQKERHSLIFPPRRRFTYLFYTISFILTLAEAGFSFSVISDLMNISTGDLKTTQILNFRFSLLYAVGISLSMAVMYKKLIDFFLFKNTRGILIFWGIFILLFAVILVLFDYKFHDLSRSLIASFFLNFFALSNAFSFREAAYLNTLFRKVINKRGFVKISTRITNYKKKIKKRMNRCEIAVAKYKHGLSLLSADNTSNIVELINSLEKASIGKFWLGYEDCLKEGIKSNSDLIEGIKTQIKNLVTP